MKMSLFLDFDGTITTEDTVTHLANFALRFQAERSGGGSNSRGDGTTQVDGATSQVHQDGGGSGGGSGGGDGDGDGNNNRDDLSARWAAVVQAYVTEYKAHATSYTPREAERRHVDTEIAFLRSQKHVERASLRRINQCALFRGISAAAFREGGRALARDGVVKLRPGFRRLVREALRRGWRVNVVSVNWSAAFIEGVCDCDCDGPTATGAGGIHVVANEVREHDGAVLGPGVLAGDGLLADDEVEEACERTGRNLTNSCDKRDAVREVMRQQNTEDKPFFYCGDSTTDMECLLEATRGIVMADDESSTLIKTLRRLGKQVPHVRDAEANDRLVWASNFEEVLQHSVFGPSP
ncbi:hypothetical protein F4777DRAFT_470456 [Nemania sp. FL0916]|nr:hypothetical protein F4777DRAFT_470456 [Nemania sp. FL0916]